MNKAVLMSLLVGLCLFISGCGTWCANNRSMCVEGFTGFQRYPDFGGQYYYTFSMFNVENAGKDNCYLNVVIDGAKMAAEIKRGEYRGIEINLPPRENRAAAVLIQRFCGGKYAGSYVGTINVSSTQGATYVWKMTDDHFQERRW